MATREHREHTRRGGWWIAACVAITAAWLVTMTASASEIYRTVDEHGNPMFTDQPPDDGAQAEPLGDIITVQPPPRSQRTEERTPVAQGGEEAPGYEGVRIVFPPAEEATRRVTGEVPVRVQLDPEDRELAEGHRVRIYVDGTSEGEAPATEVTVGPLNPGPHRLRAAVVNAEGQTLVESSEILFYLIRQTVN